MATKAELYSTLWTLSKSTIDSDLTAFMDLHKQIVSEHHGGLESELDLSLEAMDHNHFVAFWTIASDRKPFFPRERASLSDAQLQDFNQYHGKA